MLCASRAVAVRTNGVAIAALGRQLRPPQQFSVRNPSRAFIRS